MKNERTTSTFVLFEIGALAVAGLCLAVGTLRELRILQTSAGSAK